MKLLETVVNSLVLSRTLYLEPRRLPRGTVVGQVREDPNHQGL